jgi:hypothetical protein
MENAISALRLAKLVYHMSSEHFTNSTHFKAKDRVNMIGKPFKTVSAYIMPLPSDDDLSSMQLRAAHHKLSDLAQ